MTARRIIVNICRILTGVLFIISGFIKANDSVGFSYKLQEYFEIFRLTALNDVAVYISMFICIFEIFLGVTLLLGVYRRFTAWMLLLMIVFFTFLTFYSAYFHKVTDCGCFGDAIKFTPWQSFTKDIVLLVMILVIFFNRYEIRPFMRRKSAKTVAFVMLLLSVLFTFYTFYFLPVIDFRPYAPGTDIVKQMQIPAGAPKDSTVMVFVYEKDGKKYEFGMNELGKIDSTYTFIERKDKKIREGYKPPIHDFSIADSSGNDLTQQFLNEKGWRLMVVQYDVMKSDVKGQRRINELAESLKTDNKVKIWALSGSSSALNEYYRKTYHVPYQLYQTDVTTLKTIVRSNPGLVLFHDNVVVHDWPSTNIPDKERLYSYMK